MTNDTAVMITETKLTNSTLYVEATCGKVSALVCIKDWQVRVIVQNSSHKAWRKFGRAFRNAAEAVAYYKSQEVKAIILAADGLNR
jgi:hypothetical protein